MEFVSLDDESLVVFDPASGQTHIINEVGKDIISLCDNGAAVNDILLSLSEQYDTGGSDFERDVLDYLKELEKKEIIKKADGDV